MELRDFALRVVTGEDLESKLFRPRVKLTDDVPGEVLRIAKPGRPPGLRIQPARSAKVPSRLGMGDPKQRTRILHAFANHELQAVELFAWALLAFPDASREFREGLARLIVEEQDHLRMYQRRLEELGSELGAHPVSGYFWSKTPLLTTPVRFVCAMGLTFENANLDYSSEYAESARSVGDLKTARLLEKVGEDEVSHVGFGVEWLKRWKSPNQSLWEGYCANVESPLRAAIARGRKFHPEARRKAGLDDDFIRRLESSTKGDPSLKAKP